MSNINTNNSATTVKIACAIMFLAFTFMYLFVYQADILAVEQHVLSGGQTHYNRTIGAILITILLFALHLFVVWITKLPNRYHALTYFPSLLILTAITGISPNMHAHLSFGVWIWLFPLLLVLYIGAVYLIRRISVFQPNNKSNGLFSKTLWVNTFTLIVMFFLAGACSCSNDVFHYRAHAEQCLLVGDYDGAINTGVLSQATDSSLTMIRVYALSHKGRLGESLFEYNIVPGSKALLPNGESVRLLMYPERDVYKYLGGKPRGNMSPIAYLNSMESKNVGARPVADYLLCACLLDRDLDSFVRNIRKYYKIDERLPKHYREALTLYTHLRAKPIIIFHDNAMDTDFSDYQALAAKYANKTLRQSYLRDTYGNTYWYYYQYAVIVK